MRLERLNVVILRMATAGIDLLILLHRLEELDRQQRAEFGNGVARASGDDGFGPHCYVIAQTDAPKSSVMVSPLAIVNVVP